MSLINDALKKAQREREGGDTPAKQNIPTVGGSHPRRGNPADKTSFKLLRTVTVGVIVLSLLIAAIGLLITAVKKDPPAPAPVITEVPVTIRPSESAATAPSTPQHTANRIEPVPTPIVRIEAPVITPPAPQASIPTPAPAPKAPISPPVKSAPPATTTTVQPAQIAAIPSAPVKPAAVASVATVPTPKPATVLPPSRAAETPPAPIAPAPVIIPAEPVAANAVGTQGPAPDIQPLPQQPVTTGTEAEAPAPAPAVTANQEPDPKIIAFLEASRITGIKVAGGKSRVLMNNQVFKVGSIVQATSQLKITFIQSNEIQFVDESGVEYRKQFQR
ncbi:hypothetical protein [Cerasicoccus arenae]|uniref:Uncharacterized protein n=1 Tax=Cerasicoccus arenae TaxID=424488 RepID=A0A8J3GED9_9BACT|nr:hypothetical protein [Cerasicoccus arenae]MBK1859154.1 hypothetical protein [Cerasicoccus arenae]GHB98167.1 hypothetical protein GCM10007047_12710 [Cerasicoccus arenae]